ncbi:MAG: uracil-DNA glycosylase, partial [Phreatobacter sp.]
MADHPPLDASQRDALEALLLFYRDAGVDLALEEAPVDRFAAAAAEAARRAEPRPDAPPALTAGPDVPPAAAGR